MRFPLFALIVLVGCGPAAASVAPASGPDGQGGWLEIRCPRNPHKCRELASESCPDGYELQDFPIGGASRYNSPSAMDEPIGPPDKSGQMLVHCKGGSAPPPPPSSSSTSF